MAEFIRSDLEFVLAQIKIAEANAAGTPLRDLIPNTAAPFGLRTLSGVDNSLVAEQSDFGSADVIFPRMLTPDFRPAEAGTSYDQTSGLVIDSQPRLISNLIVDQTANNPAAVAAFDQTAGSEVVTGTRTDGSTFDTFFIPNVSPDIGFTSPFNTWFTFFGQFFDHGLDLIDKGGSGTIFIPLKPDDPLFDPTPGAPNFMVLTRATNLPGPDGVLGTADDIHENLNQTSPFVDQNQTYTSHPSHQVFLRSYEINAAGVPMDTGKLIVNRDLGSDGKFGTADDVVKDGMATWTVVKAQARDLLGIQLDDLDALNVPLLATDAYGNFIRGAHGLPQLVTATGLVEGNLAAPVDASIALRTGHPFLADIAATANPLDSQTGLPLLPDADDMIGGSPAPGFYDDELLGAHYIAGDGRANENIGLTTVHFIFHAEHNRQVDDIKATILGTNDPAFISEWMLPDGSWNGERLFQAAKFATEMQYQHLVFEEFARKVDPRIEDFDAPNGFDQEINPAIVSEFANTVYRFGHSMLTETVGRLDPSFASSDIGLIEAFLNPLAFEASGPDAAAAAGAIIRGVTRQVGNEIDEFVTEALRNNLLGLPLDLPAINIARGRDVGIPSLNEARREFYAMAHDSNLAPYTSWVDFAGHLKHEESIVNFIAAYGLHPTIVNATTTEARRAAAMDIVLGGAHAPADALDFLNGTGAWANTPDGHTKTGLDNVDFWVGGLAEQKMPFGSMLGSTFQFVFETQLENLQNADRMYYLARLDGQHFLFELDANTFAGMIMQNTDVTHLPHDVFSSPAFTLEVDRTHQFTGLGADGRADPVGTSAIIPLVVRDDPSTPGVDTNYLHYTGKDQVVLGGTAGNDTLLGGDSDDDTLYGDGGNDRLDGGFGDDFVHGGAGDDIITDVGGNDMLQGEDGNDVIQGGNSNDPAGELGNIITGGNGKDFIITTEDISLIDGGTGDDFILGATTNLQMAGNEGDDWIQRGTQDGAPGDNFSFGAADDVPGNDIFVSGGGFDEMIGEGGDDIFVAGDGQEKMDGLSGFDWTTYKDSTAGVTVSMLLNFFSPAHPVPDANGSVASAVAQSPDAEYDRFFASEALSGSPYGDLIDGDDQTAAIIATFAAKGSILTNFDLISGLRSFVGDAAAGPDGIVGTADDQFDAGNILIGGSGSDVIKGRNGDDLIDGDLWLNVRISVRQNADGTGPEIATYNGMDPLIPLMLNGTYNPGQLVAVRELLPGTADFDTAEYMGPRSGYTVTVDDRGTPTNFADDIVTVSDAAGGNKEGTDRLTHIERIQFADQDMVLVPGRNAEPTGKLVVSDATPSLGETLSVSNLNIHDGDNAGGTVKNSWSYVWQSEIAAGTGIFDDIITTPGVIGVGFMRADRPTLYLDPTLTTLDGLPLTGLALRVKGIYQDEHGVTEEVFSDPTAPLASAPVHVDTHPLIDPQATVESPGVHYTQRDLAFILDQIKIAERHAAGEHLVTMLDNVRVPYGLRTVDGSDNNLLPDQAHFGGADTVFPRLLDPTFRDADPIPAGLFGPGSPGSDTPTSYQQTNGFVVDADLRTISNLIVDDTPSNPAAVAAAAQTPGSQLVTGTRTDGSTFQTFEIPNIKPQLGIPATDTGVLAPFNAWMTFFGQFFDHGLDLITKGGNGTIFVPLQPDDPLYVPGSPTNFMVETRATMLPGPDGVLGTADDIHDNSNTTTPFVDQNQTYSSHPSHQVFLRAYELDSQGKPMDTGKLIENRNLGADGRFGTADDTPIGGMATWAVVKAQARELLGINLTDKDFDNVPLLATDAYGNFIRGPHGLPQVVMNGNTLVEGNLAAPVDLTNAVRTGHQFLIDIAHNATPVLDAAGNLLPDADTDVGNAQPTDAFGNNLTYDDELLDAHYIAGDGRVNENIGLTTVHEIFHSEHNRLVDYTKEVVLQSAAQGDVSFLNEWLLTPVTSVPADTSTLVWNGERLFQAAKFGTEMQYQHLVFEEFARTVQPMVDAFFAPTQVYDTHLNPAIVAEFANTVYRFGHSMLTETVDRLDPNFASSDIGLIQAFLNPLAFADSGPTPEQATGALVRGLTRQVGNEIDEFVTDALRNNLLGTPLDLAVLNLARGRDTGIPGLNEARREFYHDTGDSNLTPYTSWVDFAEHLKHEESLVNFIAAYGTHPTIEAATTLADKRAAAVLLVLGDQTQPGADGVLGTADDVVISAPTDRLDFLNSTGAWASDPNGVTSTGLDNVDFWIGGLAEKQKPFGGLLGSTFNFVFENQMEALQNADRFYYLERTASMDFGAELESNSFAKLVMANTDVTHLPAHIFDAVDYTLEVDPAKQFTGLGADGRADPTGTSLLTPLVIRDTNYLRFTGDVRQHVVLGGSDANDTLIAGDGNDTLYGDAGNDHLEGGYGNDSLRGGAGDDILTDKGGDNNFQGDDGNDVMQGGDGKNLLLGGFGNDFIVTGSFTADSAGGEGNDFILGSKANEFAMGGEGDDWIEGGTFDGVAGDNFDAFGNDPILGNDVLMGDAGADNCDGEGGDDIYIGSPSNADRFIGFSGFDWATFKDDAFGVTIGMDPKLRFFDQPPLPGSNASIISRLDLVEGLSGSMHDDYLLSNDDDVKQIAVNGATGSALTNFDLIAGLRAFVGSEAAGPDGIVGTADDRFDRGNIVLGGSGSDIIGGRGGDDLIDGDKWLNVRLSIRANSDGTGPEIGSANSLAELQNAMVAGTINPGQLVIVRELMNGTADFDSAEFAGPRAEYTITTDPITGVTTVAHIDPTAVPTQVVLLGGVVVPPPPVKQFEGTDRLTNIERLIFADQLVDLTTGQNKDPFGTIHVSHFAPRTGETITASLDTVSDGDNAGGRITGPVSYFWQQEVAPGSGFFTDAVLIGTAQSTRYYGPTLTLTPALEGLVLRVRAVYEDAHGVLEEVYSTPTLAVAAAAPGNAAPVGTVFVSDSTPLPLQAVSALNAFTDADGIVASSLSYQWQNGSTAAFADIAGATSASYTPTELDSGALLRVVVSYTDGVGHAEHVVSMPTLAVGALISGTPAGDILVGTDSYETIAGLNGDDQITALGADDLLVGGLGNDFLDGRAGADEMRGEAGNDRYVVDNAGDQVVENPGDGTDTVQSLLTAYTLPANVENLRYDGTTGSFTGTGNELANVMSIAFSPANHTLNGLAGDDILNGGSGNDTLNGGDGNDILTGNAGNDVLVGGAGNDRYVVGNVGDVIIEQANQGTDTVQTTLTSFTLGANVENLVFTGAGNFTGNGNALANVLTGAAGNDRLDAGAGNDTLNGGVGNDTIIGGSGADTLVGGAGDDLYSVDNAGDVVIEGVNQGTDAVQTTLNAYTLNGNVENLFFNGLGNFSGTGNSVDNILFGGAGNDTLSGAAGNDRLDSGAGDDNLIGGAGNDSLVGGAGNDRLEGGAGNDIMNGGAGNDVFVFAARGFGNDIIQPGFDANPAGGQDLLDISSLGIRAATFNANVHVVASGPNTLITIGTDSVLLQNVAPAEINQNDFLLAP